MNPTAAVAATTTALKVEPPTRLCVTVLPTSTCTKLTQTHTTTGPTSDEWNEPAVPHGVDYEKDMHNLPGASRRAAKYLEQ